MTKVIGYIRQSKDRGIQEHSEAYQFDALSRYHQGRLIQEPGKWPTDLVWCRDIDVSGRLVPFFSRLGGTEAKRIAESGDVIIVHRMDRMGRNAQDLIATADWFHQKGVRIHLLDMMGMQVDTSSAAGRFMLQVLAASCEFEVNRLVERNRATVKMLRSQGRRVSYGPGHGKRFVERGGKTYVEDDPVLRDTIDKAVEMHDDGMPYVRIAEYFKQYGVPIPSHFSKRGWNRSTVQKLVAKERAIRSQKLTA